MPVYFNQDPVLSVGGGGFGFGGGRGEGPAIPGVGMNITPMAGAAQNRLSAWDPEATGSPSSGRGAAAD